MGDPPSDSGGCHDNVTPSSMISVTSSGPTGAEGLPVFVSVVW